MYIIHEGDLYRTRITHALEVAQIAKSIAIQLGTDSDLHKGPDCDLTEAIALAHDLGHPPFGHVGGDVLQQLLANSKIPFEHNIQSYRIVSELEERYIDFKGLNLTYATLEGILRHRSYFDLEKDIRRNIPKELKKEVSRFYSNNQPTIEAQVVNIADSIAYATHDIEDALEMGLLEWYDFKRMIESHDIIFISEILVGIEKRLKEYENRNAHTSPAIISKIRNRTLSRTIIDKLIRETVSHTKQNLAELVSNEGALWQKIRENEYAVVALPDELERQVKTLLNRILVDHVYRDPRVMVMMQKGKIILQTIFYSFMDEPRALPLRTQDKLWSYFKMEKKKQKSKQGQKMKVQVIADYISGMTDKYAMDTYQVLTQAYEKAL